MNKEHTIFLNNKEHNILDMAKWDELEGKGEEKIPKKEKKREERKNQQLDSYTVNAIPYLQSCSTAVTI